MLTLSYGCLVTLPLLSNSTIQFTIGSMEVWLCFDNPIDLACILFWQPTFSRLVTLVSHSCHQSVLFTVLQYFNPNFSQKSFLDLYLLPMNRNWTLMRNSGRCYTSNYRSNVMVTSIRSSFRYRPENPSSSQRTPVSIYSSNS